MTAARLAPISPRMLTKEQAAHYCGLSVPAFIGACPPPAVSLGKTSRTHRWDIRQLDRWLDTFTGSSSAASVEPDMLALMRKGHARAD